MKRIAYFSITAIVMLVSFVTLAAAQSDSLADSARAARKEKKETPKKFDNDNLPKNDKLSVVGKPVPEPTEKSAETASHAEPEAEAKAKAEEEAKAGQDSEKEGDAFKQKPADGEESKD